MGIRNEASTPTVAVKAVDLNTVGDTAVHVPFAKWRLKGMGLSGVSTTLAASSATIGAYSAPAAGGTALVTPATATGLTSAAAYNARTVAATAISFSTDTLYIRVGVAHGSAATVDVYLDIESLEL
jgi:hypothetical protein